METFVLSLGGSVFAPNGKKSGVDVSYLHQFEQFIRQQVKKKRRFFIIAGGGSIARSYRDAAARVTGARLTDEDLDWLGIHATRLNGHLLRTIFRDLAYERILKHYDLIDKKATHQVVICAGWRPGWSTDYCSVLVANDYRINQVINLSNISQVYDQDPNQYPDAQPIKKMTWDDAIKLMGSKWKPGLNVPFDPVASKMAKEIGLKVIVCHGRDLDNLANILDGKEFVGTEIE